MAIKRLPRPRDPVQLGKLIVDIATGAVPDAIDDGKNPIAVESGRLGGLRGGVTRSESMSPERRAEIARMAASARWKK